MDLILTGNLQLAGKELRITPKLINVADGVTVWSEIFQGGTQEIFNIQDRIKFSLVQKLNIAASKNEQFQIDKRYTENDEAYALYLKGHLHFINWTPNGHKKSIPLFS